MFESLIRQVYFITCSIVGVHRKAQFSRIHSELGRYPLGIGIVANTIMYIKHMHKDTINQLLSEAFRIKRQLDRKSWVDSATELQEYSLKPS